MRKLLVAIVPVVLAVLIAGCSSTPAAKPHRKHAGTGLAHTGQLGATLDLTTKAGRIFAVTLSKVIDPAQGANGATPKAGKRFIGAVFTVRNDATAAINPDAATNVILIGSDGAIYTAADKTLSSCAAFPTGHFKLNPGSTTNGCVAFQVPTAVTVSQVQFLPTGGTAGDYGQWEPITAS